jgi:hypothetical protein
MTGALRQTRIQGPLESILFARANSSAPALQGLRKMLAWAGEPGWAEAEPEESVARSDGETGGSEKETR